METGLPTVGQTGKHGENLQTQKGVVLKLIYVANLFYQWCQLQKKICPSPSGVREVRQISVKNCPKYGVPENGPNITERYNATHI